MCIRDRCVSSSDAASVGVEGTKVERADVVWELKVEGVLVSVIENES